MRICTLLPLSLVLGCPNGGSTDGKTDDSGTTDARTFEDFVNVQDVWVGETAACIDGTSAAAEPDPSCQVTLPASGIVQDFQDEEGVADATVEIWSNDDISGGAGDVAQADASGNFTLDLPACTPFAYGTSTPPEWEETVDTYEVHQVYGYPDDGSFDVTFNSVSEATSRLIPGLIGVEWDTETGIIAGTAYDCNEDPIQYAQIFIHDGTGVPPATGDVFYFSEANGSSLPTDLDSQPHTNTNGLWVAMNISTGTWTVEMWGWDGGQYVLLGATVLEILAGSVNISNIYTGDDDGIFYPESCRSACEG